MVGTERHDQDAVLARRIRSGDREAVGELYDRYAGIAMAVAVRVLRDRGAAEDVVHDAFVAVWQKIDRFDVAHGSLRSWLLTIVRNRAIDRLRRIRPAQYVDELDSRSLLRSTPNPTLDAAIASLTVVRWSPRSPRSRTSSGRRSSSRISRGSPIARWRRGSASRRGPLRGGSAWPW